MPAEKQSIEPADIYYIGVAHRIDAQIRDHRAGNARMGLVLTIDTSLLLAIAEPDNNSETRLTLPTIYSLLFGIRNPADVSGA
jgi:hypothetical protein